jgi:subtilisin family serine protease/subtilase family serine protease
VRLSKALAAITLAVVVLLNIRPSAQQPNPARPFVRGEILVTFKPGAAASARADAHRAAGGDVTGEIARTRVQRVRVPAGTELAAIARYERNPNILHAEPNFVRRIDSGPMIPGDLQFNQQWGFHNTGQQFYCFDTILGPLCFYSGIADADIDVPEAWEISTGNSAVTVAVIDTGVDYTHPDLAANYAGGYDFVFADNDPMDDHGHGTHVAGTVAASLNNVTGTPGKAEGVVGVAPNARILAYKVCRSDGTCDDFTIQQAIARAVTDGAKVINLSLGDEAYSQSFDEAVQDAWNAGLVIVAAAGNNGTASPFYPAAFNNVISVAAYDEDHLRPSFSDYGSWVDIAAPGANIVSTWPMSQCAASTTPGDVGCYAYLSGTSMASPHVAGAAALVWARSDVTRNSQVVDALLGGADRNGVGATRLDSWTSHGGLNLHGALTYSLTRPVADAGTDQAVTDNDENGVATVTLNGTASFDPNGTIVSYAWREGSTLIDTTATATVPVPLGLHTFTLEVTDNDGESSTDDVTVTVSPTRQITVSASTPQATEAGSANGAFTFSRTGDTSLALTIYYKVEGTAVASTDYEALPGQVTIDSGSPSVAVAVVPHDDSEYEGNETVVVTVLADGGYNLGLPLSATVTIVSDDLPPDLVVASVTGPSVGRADADIVVTEATRNQGAGSSPSSKTGFYLSTNSTWDASDIFLGSRSVPTLAPGASDTLATTLHLPVVTTGSYFILARADCDAAVPETVETNNAKSTGSIKVGPDLMVSAVTAPATAAAGSTFSVSDTTKNQGAGDVDVSTTTRFFLSTNSTLDGADVLLGSRTAAPLEAGASDTATTSIALPAGTTAGTYYVIAQADGVNAVLETAETNNYKGSSSVRIGPDLIVSAVSAPASAAAGASITVTDTTKNQGAGAATPSSTGFYLSANSSIGSGDVFLGSRSLDALSAGGTSTASITLQIPGDTVPGTYYVVARADWSGLVTETAETNNDKASSALKTGGDLIVASLTAPGIAMASGQITVTDTTTNQGTGSVPESSTGFYLSDNSSFGSTDVFLGSRVVASLNPSQSSSASTQLSVPAGTVAGNYYVIAVADWNGSAPESNETNNTRSAGYARVGPDLTVTALIAPSSAVAGTSINAADTTKNVGGDTMPASFTSFYLARNSVLDSSAVLLTNRPVASLVPGASDTASAALIIPASTTAGLYYIIAKADGDNATAEPQESNNTRAKSITIAAAP